MTNNFTGNDEVSELERAEINDATERQRLEFEDAVQVSASAREWLNTQVGRAVQLAIKNNKLDAMERAVAGPEQDINDARFDYATWHCVEALFTAIITEGEVALDGLNRIVGDHHGTY